MAHTILNIQEAINKYLENIQIARSKNTFDTYYYALKEYLHLLQDNKIDPETTPISDLNEDTIGWFAVWLKEYSPSTEQLYLQATVGFFEFLVAERMHSPNLPRIRLLIRQRSRKVGQRLPQFEREAIEKILSFIQDIPSPANTKIISADDVDNLRLLRDKAFLLTLADTGLRVHEACNLRRGDIDWSEGRAIIIGKGNKQAIVRFSTRSLSAIKDYLNFRGSLDGIAGKALSSLPVFSRHDKGAGNKIKPITTATGRNIVDDIVKHALGDELTGKITPHSFRHYFVTTVLRASGNLKLAQELARHTNISVTQRYAHLSNDELDKGYYEIFEKNKDDTGS